MPRKIKTKLQLEQEAYSEELDAARGRIERLGSAFANTGAALSKIITAPLALIAAPAVVAAEAQVQTSRRVRAATGETGAALESLVGVVNQARAAASSGLTEATDAVVGFSKRLGLTGDDLRDTSAAALRLSRQLGTDLGATVDGLAGVLAAWHVPASESAGAVERLQVAARLSTGGISRLTQRLSEAAPVFKAAGLSLDDAAGLLAQMERAGVPADEALGGLKKAITALAKDGLPDIRAALAKHFEAIRSAPDAESAAREAVELFGKKGVLVSDAIRRGALSLDGIKTLTGRMPNGEPVKRLGLAFTDLRIKIETALLPIGTAVRNVAMPSITAAISIAQALVEGLGAVARGFASMPEWLQTAVVVVAGIVALVGPALLFAASITQVVSALIGRHLVVLLSLKVVPTAMTWLARGAIVGAVLGFRRMLSDLPAVAGSKVPALVAAAGLAVSAGVSNGVGAVRSIEARSGSSFDESARAAKSTKFPRQADLPPFTAPGSPSFDGSPVTMPGVSVPSMPEYDAPTSPDMSWNAAYDWFGQFTNAIGGAIQSYGRTFSSPVMQDARQNVSQVAASGDLKAAIAKLREIGALKGVRFSEDPEKVAAELKRAESMLTLGDSLRLHAPKVAETYAQLTKAGIIGVAPVMPGSWLDINRPENWYAKAEELDRLARDQKQKTQFYADQRAWSDKLLTDEWNQKQAALKAAFGTPIMGMAQVYNVADVAAAVHQGIAQGEAQRMQGGFSMVSTFGGASTPPPPPPASKKTSAASSVGARQIAATKSATNAKPKASSGAPASIPGFTSAQLAQLKAGVAKATVAGGGG